MQDIYKDNLIYIYKKYRNVILYGIIGLSGVMLDIAIYNLLINLSVYYQIANVISVHVGIINNFIWNALINYRIKNKHFVKLLRFYSVGLCGWGLSALLLFIFKDLQNVPEYINSYLYFFNPMLQPGEMLVKAFVVCIVVLFQFLLNHYFSFRKD
jgi:putative flippase GtrA